MTRLAMLATLFPASAVRLLYGVTATPVLIVYNRNYRYPDREPESAGVNTIPVEVDSPIYRGTENTTLPQVITLDW